MSTGEDREICCCGTAEWTNMIAWFQIVSGVLGAIFYGWFAVQASKLENWRFWGVNTREMVIAIFIVSVVICVTSSILGVVLFVGNRKKRASYLVTWKALTCISLGLFVIAKIVDLFSNRSTVGGIISALVTASVTCFMIYVVDCRVREIKAIQETTPTVSVRRVSIA